MGTSIVEQVEIIETTECRFCRQVIDQRANRCPYCQVSQSTRSRPSRPGKFAFAMFLVVVGGSTHFDRQSFDATPDHSVALAEATSIEVPRAVANKVAEPQPQVPAEFDPEDMPLIGSVQLLEQLTGSAEHQPLICAGITDATSICEHLVRSLERQGWNFGPAGYLD